MDDYPNEFIYTKEKRPNDDDRPDDANKKLHVDITKQFDYENTHDKHAKVWKGFPPRAHRENLEILDDQLESYREHYLCTGTDVINPGYGEYNPEIVFIMRSPGRKDVCESNLAREAFMDSGNVIRRIANVEFNNSKCYYMFLVPFRTSNLTADIDVYNGMKDDKLSINWFIIPDSDYQIFLDYAKQRLICLNPKIVVCLGNDVFKIVMANFKLSSMSTLVRFDVLRKKCITEDTKLTVADYCKPFVIPFPSPYSYSVSLTSGVIGSKGRNVCDDWDESLIKLKMIVSRKNVTGDVLSRMMKSSKEDAKLVKLAKLMKDKRVQTSIKNWGGEKPEKSTKGIRRPRVDHIGYDPNQPRLGIETVKRKCVDDALSNETKRSKITHNDEDTKTSSSTKDEIIF